jgi:hypothetical protein
MSLFSFLFHKIGKQEGRTVLPWGAEGIIGRGEVVGKGSRRMNTVQNMYIHVCKCKNNTF